MLYLLTLIVFVIIARVLGPLRRHRDLDQQLRDSEDQHRSAVYGASNN